MVNTRDEGAEREGEDKSSILAGRWPEVWRSVDHRKTAYKGLHGVVCRSLPPTIGDIDYHRKQQICTETTRL